MYAGIIIMVLAAAGTLSIYQWIKWKRAGTNILSSPAPATPYTDAVAPVKNDILWMQLALPIQLELALSLARLALPAWQKYCEVNPLLYRNSPTGPTVSIDPGLLKRSLDHLETLQGSAFTEKNSSTLHWYNQFVTPLIALQDGNLLLAYPVKKIFLAVYNILRAVAKVQNHLEVKQLLVLSIHQSLDCLDRSRLYNAGEIEALLAAYRAPAQ